MMRRWRYHGRMGKRENVLFEAAITGKASVVTAALAAGANIHADDDEALRWAAFLGHVDVVQILLAAGANVHADHDGALRSAADHGHAEIARCLMAARADPVIALKSTPGDERGDVTATLDACAAALTSEQRAALLAVAHPDEFVQLRAIAASAEKHRAIHR